MTYRSHGTRIIMCVALIGAALAGAHAATVDHSTTRQSTHKSPFVLMSASPRTLTDSALVAADKGVTKGTVSADKKAVSFSQKTVRLLVHTGPSNDMLSYRVNGLRNPTISVTHGATLKILFVNNDDDMFHNIRFGAKPASFSVSADTLLKTSAGAIPVAHVDNKALHGVEMVIKVPNHAGTYAYFCTVRGHAPGGMWGVIQAR